MPIQKIGNKYRFGKTGKLYSSRSKAIKQGAAIKIAQNKRKK
jgi:hypothetical protein